MTTPETELTEAEIEAARAWMTQHEYTVACTLARYARAARKSAVDEVLVEVSRRIRHDAGKAMLSVPPEEKIKSDERRKTLIACADGVDLLRASRLKETP